MKPGNDTIRDMISRFIKACTTSDGKRVLVFWSKDRADNFVPQDGSLRLHVDSVEFIDEDGTHTVLSFSSIARIEIDEDDLTGEVPSPKIDFSNFGPNVVPLPRK